MEYGGKELCDEKSCHCLLFASILFHLQGTSQQDHYCIVDRCKNSPMHPSACYPPPPGHWIMKTKSLRWSNHLFTAIKSIWHWTCILSHGLIFFGLAKLLAFMQLEIRRIQCPQQLAMSRIQLVWVISKTAVNSILGKCLSDQKLLGV